ALAVSGACSAEPETPSAKTKGTRPLKSDLERAEEGSPKRALPGRDLENELNVIDNTAPRTRL
ncbi:MAG: hypothetical protein AAFQ82_16280, partial [Myxococcota bacterium]